MSNVPNDYIEKLNDIEIFYRNGNIGISKENPVYKLDIDGSTYSDNIYLKMHLLQKGLMMN